MDYAAALAYLLAPTDPSRPVVARPDANLNLPRMRRVLDLLGAPDARYDAVVIAGTKGKGSTAALLAAIENLPPTQREAFLLQAEGGMAVEEIASTTGVSFETAKSRLRYARNSLRERLQELVWMS